MEQKSAAAAKSPVKSAAFQRSEHDAKYDRQIRFVIYIEPLVVFRGF